MEVIMSSPVNECLGMENDTSNAIVKITTARKKNMRRKLKKKMKANQEDTENPKSKPEVHLNTISPSEVHLNTISPSEVHLNTISPSSLQDNPNTGLRTSEIVEQNTTVSSPAAPGVEKSSVLGIENDNGNGAVKLNKSQKKNRRKAIKKKLNANREDTENSSVSKSEEHAKVANGEMGSSATTNLNAEVKVQNKMETAIGETGSGTNTTDNTSPKKRKRRGLRNKNPGSSEIFSTHESTQHTVLAKNESSATANVNVKGMAEEQNKMETAIGETGSGTNTTDNTTSKRQKRKSKNKNPGSSDILSTHESTQGKVIATNDSSATTNVNVKGMAEEQNKMEMPIGEMGSGTNATDNTTSKKRKRKKLKNTNPASGDILSTRESTEDMVIAKKESSTTNVLEAMNGQMVSQGEAHMQAAIGKMGPGAIKNLNANDAVKMENKLKSENKRPTLGEILNPQYVESLEAANSVENKNAEKKNLVIVERKAKANQALIRNFWRQREKNAKMGIKEVFQAATLGKKLIIFDVNGLLADLVSPRPMDVIADFYIPRKAIFKRPFLEDFLCFCFERFNVGIWSSRTKDNLDLAAHFLLGDLKKKLLFLWDATKCTHTGMKTLEDKYKHIVLKDLRKIWKKVADNNRWVKGTFDESNTLLIDDSRYKALLNPKHNGIFPTSYCYKNRDDNFLGPKGELRTYLEGLAACDNVQTYVEQHPFGQGAIDEKDPHWAYYKRVLKGQN